MQYVPGTVTLSLEIELGWGLVQYDKIEGVSPGRQVETTTLDRLLSVCDELQIPISFDVVGHLLHDGPLPTYDGGHPAGWFDDIPVEGSQDHPLFYAPDLVERIAQADVDHEICSHTFTHVECEQVSAETLRWEFDNVLKTHTKFGLERPTSLVPPRHSPPPRDILREFGFEIVRSSRSRAPDSRDPSSILQLGKDILTGAQPITAPRLRDGIVETYGTGYPSLTSPLLPSGQLDSHPLFRPIPVTVRQKLHDRNFASNLETTIERDSNIHVWSHLWEMANDAQWTVVERCLRRIAEGRESHQISICTMQELNSEVRSKE